MNDLFIIISDCPKTTLHPKQHARSTYFQRFCYCGVPAGLVCTQLGQKTGHEVVGTRYYELVQIRIPSERARIWTNVERSRGGKRDDEE